jgi:two-component system response regulator GlrR
MAHILVVDDDRSILKVLKMRLEAEGFAVSTATGSLEALDRVKAQAFDLGLVDLKLSQTSGIELMTALHRINPEMPVIILTAYGTIKSAVTAMSQGAHSYITKPFDYQELLLQIKGCMEKNRLFREVRRLKNLVKQRYGYDNIIGRSRKMGAVLAQINRTAATDSSIYIEGESGTGKELIAKTVHLASGRQKGPFVAVNCAAIPENLLESELFGYRKGAFTGADRHKQGLLSTARGGTFFLDEISEMPLSMQAKLLRVLQEKEVCPLGGGSVEKIDARFVATSNRNLEEAVKTGQFREDLFYRIHVIVIKLPPLRERAEDIPLLAQHFLKRYTKKTDKAIRGFSPAALQKMMRYSWPGNVRELENTIEGAVAMTTRDVISEGTILQHQPLKDCGLKPFKSAKGEFEKQYMVQLMAQTRGNISRAAELSGKYRADLYDLLKKYGLKAADFREGEGAPEAASRLKC